LLTDIASESPSLQYTAKEDTFITNEGEMPLLKLKVVLPLLSSPLIYIYILFKLLPEFSICV